MSKKLTEYEITKLRELTSELTHESFEIVMGDLGATLRIATIDSKGRNCTISYDLASV